jgi:gliding motility-associated-like protein
MGKNLRFLNPSGFLKCVVLALTLIFSLISQKTDAQVITISRANGTIVNGDLVCFPAAGHGPSYIIFTIQNTGGSVLILSGSPAVQVTGTNATEFVVTQQPSTTIASGGSTTFKVVYTPSLTSLSTSTAQLRIISNTVSTPFLINLKGGGNLFYGYKWPPVDNGTYQVSTTSNEAGRAGGRTITVGLVSLSDKTTTYWGPALDSSNTLGLKLSLDGSTFSGQEVFTYSPTESNLPNGIAVWRGQTRIANAITGTFFTVYTRATLTTRRPVTNAVVALTNPAILGLSEQAGGVVLLNSSSDYVNANYFVEASLTSNSGFQPYLNFYDAYPTPPGPLPGAGAGAAYVTITNGSYWINQPPKLAVNQIFSVNEGGAGTITTAFLRATDDEDLNFNVIPEKIVFEFKSNTSNNNPMVFDRGVIRRNGIALNKTDSFTLKDIQDGIISYLHDGSETIYDEFQFSIKDSKKTLAVDNGFTVFTFKIDVLPVNDLPVAQNANFSGSYAVPLNGTLTATDAENSPLVFSVVTPPAAGNLVLNANGSFTYTPAVGATAGNVITFTYRVHDGTAFSNTATVTITLVNLPPAGAAAIYRTVEDIAVNGLMQGVDPEGSAVSFQITKQPVNGTVTPGANGSFVYQPSLTKFGTDYFIYKAADIGGNLSAGDTVTIHIMPRLDEGNLLIADKTKIHLYDPATNQDTVISRDGSLVQAQNVFYKKGTSLFALDQTSGLLKIDPMSGTQVVLAPSTSFSGGPGPLGITLHPSAGYLVIADGSNGVRSVDTTTGVVTNLFTGGSIQFATGVVYLNNGNLLVSDGGIFAGGSSKIISITPAGTQTVVTTGGLVTLPVDLALIDQNTIVVTDGGSMAGGTDRVYKVAVATGVQTLVSASGQFAFPSGLDYEVRIGKLYVISQNNAKLLDIDPVSGVQTQLPTPSYLVQPFGMMVIGPATRITSVTVPPDSTYIIGQNLDFIVNYSSNVTVNTAGGSPVLTIIVGGIAVTATYVSGSGTSSLLFRYTVVEGHADTDGVALTALQSNGGQITASGIPADSALVNVGSTLNVLVDGIRPTVTSINRLNPLTAITNANTVVFRVNFSEAVKNISTSSFSLSGTATGNISSVSTSTGTSVDVTVNTVSGPGTLRLDFLANGLVKDLPGNAATAGFTTGEEYTINNYPVFVEGAGLSKNTCINLPVDLSAGIRITDNDNGQTLTWSVATAPLHGILNGFPVSLPANGAMVTPAGLSYTPAAGFGGLDSFIIQVSDGITNAFINVYITVIDPVPAFTINTPVQCLNGNTFTFTNGSSVNTGGLTYEWFFGDGNISSALSPSHSYTTEGLFTVKLRITSTDGCVDSLEQDVTVQPKPIPSFAININSQCLTANSFVFTNTSTVPAGTNNYSWDYGDGSFSTSPNGSHTYAAAGPYFVKLLIITSAGCADSITLPLTVHPQPMAAFSINNAAQCLNGNNFVFTNGSSVSTGTISSEWTFGDGNQTSAISPAHSYISEGPYDVKLLVTTNNGCKDSLQQSVTVYPKPVVGFSINDTGQCITGNQFNFTNTSGIASGTISHEWSFADGNTASTLNTSHSYAAANTYLVKLVSTSNFGCKDSSEQAVDVFHKPTPLFTINSAAQCLNGNNFVFTNGSAIGSGTMTYMWNFGDGGGSAGSNAAHSYNAAFSPYQVKLIAISNNGCIDSLSLPVTVYPKPQVGFTVNAFAQCVNGNNFIFSNTSSVTAGTMSYSWDFGDGNFSTTPGPSHVYAVAGNYRVKLYGTTNNSCVDSFFVDVVVHPKPTPLFSVNQAVQCLNGNDFAFTNNSGISKGSMSYNWNFGDGFVSAATNPSHSYLFSGPFTVMLVVSSAEGCKDSIPMNLLVHDKPVPSFTINTNSQCLTGNNFIFTNSSTVASGTLGYSWSFGDGGNASTVNASHSYAVPGSFAVKLLVTTNNGCKDSLTQFVSANPEPIPSFTMNTVNQCVNTNNYSFTNTSTIAFGTMTYSWAFGDGNLATSINASHVYSGVSTYPVVLTATSDKGCTATANGTANVLPIPFASFGVNAATGCLTGNQFFFTNTSVSTPVTYNYFFGDGATDVAPNPSHSYVIPGDFEVKFVTISAAGCISDTARQMIKVFPDPIVNAGPDLTVLEGNSIRFEPLNRVAGQTYKWTPNTYFVTPDTVWAATVKPVFDMTYKLTTTGAGSCTASDQVFVKVLKLLSAPNAFSPNGDGINDTWIIPYLRDYPGSKIEIFSRSGQLVFTGTGTAVWNGKLNGQPLPVGTYYYVITPYNGRSPFSGAITIIK